MAESRKSAARMRTYRGDKAQAGEHAGEHVTQRHDDDTERKAPAERVRTPVVIRTSDVPSDEYESINAHRMPVARHIREAMKRHGERAANRRHVRIMRRARRQMRHPYARQRAIAASIVAAFAIVAVVGIVVGNGTVRDANTGTAANASDTTPVDTLSTTRGQREALAATGLYDTFMLRDGMPIAELLDGSVTPAEASARQSILDARAAEAAADDADSDGTGDGSGVTDADGNGGNETPQGGLGNVSGTITSDQANEGRQKVMDALNQYAGDMQNAMNGATSDTGIGSDGE